MIGNCFWKCLELFTNFLRAIELANSFWNLFWRLLGLCNNCFEGWWTCFTTYRRGLKIPKVVDLLLLLTLLSSTMKLWPRYFDGASKPLPFGNQQILQLLLYCYLWTDSNSNLLSNQTRKQEQPLIQVRCWRHKNGNSKVFGSSTDCRWPSNLMLAGAASQVTKTTRTCAGTVDKPITCAKCWPHRAGLLVWQGNGIEIVCLVSNPEADLSVGSQNWPRALAIRSKGGFQFKFIEDHIRQSKFDLPVTGLRFKQEICQPSLLTFYNQLRGKQLAIMGVATTTAANLLCNMAAGHVFVAEKQLWGPLQGSIPSTFLGLFAAGLPNLAQQASRNLWLLM